MFFTFRKKAKLAEEAKKLELQLLQEEAAAREHENYTAYEENKKIFVNIICHMVRSLPKRRQIVVIMRKDVFRDKYEKNKCYLALARKLYYDHRSNVKWISGYNKSIYAFKMPTKLDEDFNKALLEISEGGYRIYRIRYYRI